MWFKKYTSTRFVGVYMGGSQVGSTVRIHKKHGEKK